MTCLCDTHVDDATCRLVTLARLNSGCFDEHERRERDRSFSGVSCLTVDEYRTRNAA